MNYEHGNFGAIFAGIEKLVYLEIVKFEALDINLTMYLKNIRN